MNLFIFLKVKYYTNKPQIELNDGKIIEIYYFFKLIMVLLMKSVEYNGEGEIQQTPITILHRKH